MSTYYWRVLYFLIALSPLICLRNQIQDTDDTQMQPKYIYIYIYIYSFKELNSDFRMLSVILKVIKDHKHRHGKFSIYFRGLSVHFIY